MNSFRSTSKRNVTHEQFSVFEARYGEGAAHVLSCHMTTPSHRTNDDKGKEFTSKIHACYQKNAILILLVMKMDMLKQEKNL